MKSLLRCLVPFALAGLVAGAHAHSSIPGTGAFYGGMLHPAVVPAHLIAVLAIGLWLGQRWPTDAAALAALLVALPIGMIAGTVFRMPQFELVVLAIAAPVAVAAAAARAVPRLVVACAGAALGLALGLDSQPDGISGSKLWLALLGTWAGVFVGVAWLIVVSEFAQRPWMKIALRVVASWLAASALLVLALAWVGPRTKLNAPAAAASSAVPESR